MNGSLATALSELAAAAGGGVVEEAVEPVLELEPEPEPELVL